MKLSSKQLRSILREVMEECGHTEPQDHGPSDDHASLGDMVDMLSKNVEPMKVGHGGKAKMARGHLYHISNRAQSLHDRLNDDDELPEWVQSKLAVAESMVNAVYDHLDYKLHNYNKLDHGASLSEVHEIIREVMMDAELDDDGMLAQPEDLPEEPDQVKPGAVPDAAPVATDEEPDAESPAQTKWDKIKDALTPSEETRAAATRVGKGAAVVGALAGGAAAAQHLQAKQRRKARKGYGK